jgi:hypothetical protein
VAGDSLDAAKIGRDSKQVRRHEMAKDARAAPAAGM